MLSSLDVPVQKYTRSGSTSARFLKHRAPQAHQEEIEQLKKVHQGMKLECDKNVSNTAEVSSDVEITLQSREESVVAPHQRPHTKKPLMSIHAGSDQTKKTVVTPMKRRIMNHGTYGNGINVVSSPIKERVRNPPGRMKWRCRNLSSSHKPLLFQHRVTHN